MKVISRSLIFAMVLYFGLCLAGCTESSSSGISDDKARLLGSENIELKTQLKRKDKEIVRQKTLLADCQKANAKLKARLKHASQEQGLEIMKMFKAMKKGQEKK